MVIDINKQQNVKIIRFPDGQIHIKLEVPDENLYPVLDVVISICNADDLIALMMVSDAIDREKNYIKGTLTIKYLMGARYDRVMVPGDSFDLKIVANIINSLKFEEIYIVDPHSDVATALIDNSEAISNKFLVDQYVLPDSILIIPDGGAIKKSTHYREWNSNIVDETLCIKHRDVATGKLTIKMLEPEKCANRNCVIIDDLCDGGGTFLGISEQVKRPQSLTLIITHGIFSKGVDILRDSFTQIITSDSYASGNISNDFLKIIPCPLNTMN